MELDVGTLVGAMEAHEVDTATAMIKRFTAAAVAATTAEHDALEPMWRARDREGTPLVTLAVRLDQSSVLDALLDGGCACQEKEPDEDEDEDDDDDDDDTYHGCSPLCEAIQLGHDACARVLVAHGASVDAPSRADSTDYTPVHTGVLHGWNSAFFRDQALAMSLAVDARDVADYTPLHLAVVYSVSDAAQRLIAAGADARAAVTDDVTLLHVAVTSALTPLVAWLLDDCVVDVDARDAYGNTPLLEATFVGQHRMRHVVRWGSPEKLVNILEILLDHGADVNAANRDGNTPVFGAAWNGFADAIRMLLDRGASVRATNLRGETVLHVAARSPALLPTAAWGALLRAGADVDARDGEGRTFLEVWTAHDEASENLEEVRALVECLRGEADPGARHWDREKKRPRAL